MVRSVWSGRETGLAWRLLGMHLMQARAVYIQGTQRTAGTLKLSADKLVFERIAGGRGRRFWFLGRNRAADCVSIPLGEITSAIVSADRLDELLVEAVHGKYVFLTKRHRDWANALEIG